MKRFLTCDGTVCLHYTVHRHTEFVENGNRFNQSKVGKYESAWILEESEDLKLNFKDWMLQNRRLLSLGKAANYF